MRLTRFRLWCTVFFCSLLATHSFFPVAAQETKPDPLVTQLSKNSYPLAVEGGKLTGAGADFLKTEAKSAQFVLVGEDHGIAEMPQLTGMLFQDLHPLGFDYFASEIGPLAATRLEKLAGGNRGTEGLAEFNQRYPYGAAFYFWQEECAMLGTIGHTTAKKSPWLWGLDQEFIFSAKLHFERLAELTKKTKAAETVNEFLQPTTTEFARMVESKNPMVPFMASAKEADFNRLEAALKPLPNPEIATIFRELKESWEIYQKNFKNDGYGSNSQRAAMMKRHFMQYYTEALKRDGKPPKVLFKFGMMHIKRGRSFLNVHDIGNLAGEISAGNGMQSLHVAVIGAGGTQNSYLPFIGNVADKKKAYDPVKELDIFDVKPLITAAAGNKSWTVFDLRPLRPLLQAGKLGKPDPQLKEFIWSHDVAVVIPEVHAATFFGD